MSNTWSYTLVFQEKRITNQMFRNTIELADALGYSIYSPHDSKIGGISLEGMDSLEFDELEIAQTIICSQGGLVNLWKSYKNDDVEDDISVTFNPIDGHISIGTTHELHSTDEDDVRKAHHLEGLFRVLCQRLKPIYGYSSDAYRTEFALGAQDFFKKWENFEKAIEAFALPPILFWLNYFSEAYLQNIREVSFDSVPNQREVVDGGVFLYLANYPWEASLAVLKSDKTYQWVQSH